MTDIFKLSTFNILSKRRWQHKLKGKCLFTRIGLNEFSLDYTTDSGEVIERYETKLEVGDGIQVTMY